MFWRGYHENGETECITSLYFDHAAGHARGRFLCQLPLWTEGEEISGEYTLPPWRYGVTVDKNEEIVKATGDVKINNNDTSNSWPIIGASGQEHKSFTLDMDGHTLTAGEYGFFC